MQITDVKLTNPVFLPVEHQTDAINTLPLFYCLCFCQVFTDEDVTGLVPSRGDSVNRAFIEDVLKPYVQGENPMNNERIWDKMYWETSGNGRRDASMIAMSAIDNAVWDIKGKISNQPVHQLLGGFKDSVNLVWKRHQSQPSKS
jgi:L-alanine-DL-glutamate epimerase-like enolase superfamily enzyme